MSVYFLLFIVSSMDTFFDFCEKFADIIFRFLVYRSLSSDKERLNHHSVKIPFFK